MSQAQERNDFIQRNPACGPVIGSAKMGVANFLGIPFAEPPVGPLRFQAPQKMDPWPEPRLATAYGPTAPQPNRASTLIPEPEEAGDEYLNLNVFAPAELPDSPFPVVVYIHGGGYSFGCNRSPWFEGDGFVRNDVVLVTPSYRLNVEGFMPIDGAPHNRALLDWIAALEWVRDNIKAFGGNPAAITLAGQSAGAGAVAALMAGPKAAGLFHRALLFSGSIGFGGSMKRAQQFAQRFARAVDLPLEADAMNGLSRRELIAGLEKAAPEPGIAGPGAGFVQNVCFGQPLQPLAGTESLPLAPADAFANGHSKDIPALLTTTCDEFVFEFEPHGGAIDEQYLLAALGKLGVQHEKINALYPHYAPARLLGQVVTDLLMRAPMVRMADIREKTGAVDTWTAEFRRHSPMVLASIMRAAHCLDMPYYFDKLQDEGAIAVGGKDAPQALANSMHQTVIRFAKGEDMQWSPWSENHSTQIWDWPETGETNDLHKVYDYCNDAEHYRQLLSGKMVVS